MSGVRFDFTEVFDADDLRSCGPCIDANTSHDDAELLGDCLDKLRGMRVFDVARGHGRIELELAEHGMRVTGVVTSELLLRQARAAAERQRPAIELVARDIRRAAFTRDADRMIAVARR